MNNDSPSTAAASTSTSPASTSSPTVHAFALKLPPYWPNDPIVWFAQVEAQFLTRNITSQSTKFAYVISSLQPDIAQEIRDILISPLPTNPYEVLKSELIKGTSASEQKRFNQLLISEELGDRKPSQLLRRMRQLLGDNNLENGILKRLFLQRLPQNIQLILASTPDTVQLDELALLADKILEVAPPQPSIASISPSPVDSSVAKEIYDLRNQVNSLTTQLATLVTQGRFQPCTRSYSRSRSRGRSPATSQSSTHRRDASATRPQSSICWYHRQFGSNAHHCTMPCSFTANNSTQQSENYQASD
ncbi:uncharacterized protein LOC135683893 [Rhopilema esculentum]|uniref:uncharacterized protein LOC135683893 n=1 Tax=Rhopilema esculentum TaxID=499914 RepID=UPI0031D1E258